VNDYDFILSHSNDGSLDLVLTDNDDQLRAGATAAEDVRLYEVLPTYSRFSYRKSSSQIVCSVLETIEDCEEHIPLVISKSRTSKGAPGSFFDSGDEYYEFKDDI
jgi:hypothetical protein